MSEVVTIDGAYGEGGGQILRTCLSASLLTGRAFHIDRIRAGRRRPGLLAQHLTAVRAAAAVGKAAVDGDHLGSDRLDFAPTGVRPGRHAFAVGTAGSACLVLQAVLPPLLTADRPSTLELGGGTHNPAAPPFEFIDRTFLPLIGRMGPRVGASLRRPGFHPAGGGSLVVEVEPVSRLEILTLRERGEILAVRAEAVVARLPRSIADRELAVIGRKLGWEPDMLTAAEVEADGPGNVVTAEIESEHIIEVFTGFGRRGLRAEAVAQGVVEIVQRYLRAGVPVGRYLADQLLVPLAQAGGGSFVTVAPTSHFRTNAFVLERFLGTRITTSALDGDQFLVEIE